VNCTLIAEMIGYACHPIDEEASLAEIDIPFTFVDGDAIPAYVEHGPDFVRFFDDGEIDLHFSALGVFLENGNDTRFISDIARANGASFSDTGVVSVEAAPQDCAAAFAKYLSCMCAFARWEKARDEAMKVARELSLAR
jgi:hypothetical protein